MAVISTICLQLMAQHLPADRRRKIERLYLSGVKPAEIALKLGIKPASLRQHLYRAGLTQRREEIEEVKQRTAREILESVRQRNVEDFETVLDSLSEGAVIDAERLRDGWDMVQDAAGASSLMRAKCLLQDRATRFFGLDKEADAAPSLGINLFVFKGTSQRVERPVETVAASAAKPVVPTPLDDS